MTFLKISRGRARAMMRGRAEKVKIISLDQDRSSRVLIDRVTALVQTSHEGDI